MFSHIMLGANDIEESKKFYDAVLGAIGVKPGTIDPKGRVFYMTKEGIFSLSKPIDGKPAGGRSCIFTARPRLLVNAVEVGSGDRQSMRSCGTLTPVQALVRRQSKSERSPRQPQACRDKKRQ